MSGISKEDFRLIDTIENDYDATTAAALDAVQRRGEMVVRILDPRIHLTKTATDAAKKFLMLQVSQYFDYETNSLLIYIHLTQFLLFCRIPII